MTKTAEESWTEARIAGAAVRTMHSRITKEGFTGDSYALTRWLTWLTVVGAHPERYTDLLDETEEAG